MTWDELRIGDVVVSYSDLLLVVDVSPTRISLLALDANPEIVGGRAGTIEVWDSDEPGWSDVLKEATVVFRAND